MPQRKIHPRRLPVRARIASAHILRWKHLALMFASDKCRLTRRQKSWDRFLTQRGHRCDEAAANQRPWCGDTLKFWRGKNGRSYFRGGARAPIRGCARQLLYLRALTCNARSVGEPCVGAQPRRSDDPTAVRLNFYGEAGEIEARADRRDRSDPARQDRLHASQ